MLIPEALAELSNSVTPAKAGVQKWLGNLDSGFRRNDAQGLLQEAHLKAKGQAPRALHVPQIGPLRHTSPVPDGLTCLIDS